MMRRRSIFASRRTPYAEPTSAPAVATSTEDVAGQARTRKSAHAPVGRSEPTKREIADRAYFIYLARGGADGDPVADWLQAERELRGELRRSTSSGRRF